MEAQLQGPNECITLGITPLTIGRAPDNQLTVNDHKSSSNHAIIKQDGATYTITDLTSTNGTFLNDVRLNPNEPYPLSANDTIRIGDTRFTYLITGVPEIAATERAMPPMIDEISLPAYNPSTPAPTEYAPYAAGPTEYASPMPMAQGTEYAPPTPPPTEYAPAPSFSSNRNANEMVPPPPPPMNPPYSGYMNNNLGGQNNFSNYTPPVQKERKNSRWLIIGAVLLLIMLVGAGVIAYSSEGSNNTNNNGQNNTNTTKNPTDPAASKQNSTPTTGQQGNTGNPIPNTGNPDQTGQTANLYDPQMSNLVMNDPLTSPGNGWKANSGCVFSQTGLTVASGDGTAEICTESQSFTDFTYALDVVMDSQTCGGMQFRLSQTSDGYNGYSFEICPDGTFILGLVANSQIQSNNYLATNIKSQINEIAVVAQGQSLTFFINGVQAKTLTDSTYTQGTVAVLSDAGDNSGQAGFGNARIWI